LEGFCRFFAAFEDGGVPRLYGERGNVSYYFRPGLEDDEEDADGTSYSSEFEVII
jgi:hypothetical protein